MEGKSFAISDYSRQNQVIFDTKDLEIIGSSKPCKNCHEVRLLLHIFS